MMVEKSSFQVRSRQTVNERGSMEEEEEDAGNDEENIVIDLADEDEDEEEEFERNMNFINNNNNHIVSRDKKSTTELQEAPAITFPQFNVGDLVWFDPMQLGYSIPGKVIDYYPELTLLTVKGYAQPSGDELNSDKHNKQLLSADQTLQMYDLSDPKQFKSLKLRKPLTKENGVADLAELEELSQESIIWNLKLRYKQELIYTRCGRKILISVNPFKQLNNVYDLNQVNKYDTINATNLSSLQQVVPGTRANKLSRVAQVCNTSLIRWLLLNDQERARINLTADDEPEPHIFELANEALKRLLISGQDQSFVLLGESGSGKTETSKLIVQYLASVNKSPTNLITEQILESIQFLESFGNAKTIHNNNSSRFGKLLDIRFNLSNSFITNAKIIDLNLLDRTRIVSQNENERNYHIFYELLAGLSKSEKEKYGLQSAEKYFYLNQGNCVEFNAKEDCNDFRALLSSMQVLGFSSEEQDTIFRLLASILHLGNIYFHRKVLAVRAGKLYNSLESGGVEGVEIGSDTEIRWLSHLLQIQFDSVMRCLTVRTTETSSTLASNVPGQPAQLVLDRIITPLNIDQALDTRDAIARALYTCLFKWLIQRINIMINADASSPSSPPQYATTGKQSLPEPIYLCKTSESLCEFQPDRLIDSRQSSLARKSTSVYSQQTTTSSNNKQLGSLKFATITILDAFGFENLSENNFEQLCINYSAELLQYHTTRYLIRLEQAEYVRERLNWTPIQLHSTSNNLSSNGNQQANSSTAGAANAAAAIVNLISKKPLGILALLDDECNFPKATDQSFAEKCHHNHTLNENYQRARLASNCQEFGVRHFRQSERLVWYQVEGFIEKNRDSLRPDILDLLVGSKMTIVSDMLRKLHPTTSDSGTLNSSHSGSGKTLSRTYDGRYVSMKPRATSVAARFQDVLNNNKAIGSINYSSSSSSQQALPGENAHYGHTQSSLAVSKPNPWFVICLKPNRSHVGQVFDVAYVQDQMRCMNVLELSAMRKFGYPIRMRYGEFVRRYKCLVPQKFLNNLASCQDIQAANERLLSNQQQQQVVSTNSFELKRAIRDVCSAIVEYRFKQERVVDGKRRRSRVKSQYQCGLTKMFLNESLYCAIEQMRLCEHQKAVSLLQKTLRMWVVRRDYLMKRQATIVIQSHARAFLCRRAYYKQYYLIVSLQRRWRHFLALNRSKLIEARRRAQREHQLHQLQEFQAKQRKQANQFRYRAQANANNNNGLRAISTRLDIPQDLAHLYRCLNQRHWRPIHDCTNVSKINLKELAERERGRRLKNSDNILSVPFIALVGEEKKRRNLVGNVSVKSLDEIRARGEKILLDLDANERYSLQQFIMNYFTIDVPQFGYSRLPITRPFNFKRMSGMEKVELEAIVIYKLILRYIDGDLEQRTSLRRTSARVELENSKENSNDEEEMQKLSKFKLIADYIIYLCLNEPLLRDEVFLQLASQSWQNPRANSVENVWKLMANCLSCFGPLDKSLRKFLIKYTNDYCIDKYRQLIVDKLFLVREMQTSRNFPPTMLEYLANEEAIERYALSASCYMDDHALSGPIESIDNLPELSLEAISTTNHSSRTLVEINSFTSAEQFAAAILRSRKVSEANTFGWSVEVQHESGLIEFSSRLRGHDQLFDHLSRVEMLPELNELFQVLECEPQKSEANRRHSATGAESRRNSRISSELDLSMQRNKFGRRYAPADEHYAAAEEEENLRLRNRRSMSMQELQLASSALNGRYFDATGHHYAASYIPQRHQVNRRRSQTPNSMLAASSSHRMGSSSSAYGSASCAQSPYAHMSATDDSVRRGRGSDRASGSLTRDARFGRNSRPRRSASTSSRTPRGFHSDYASTHSDYERVGNAYHAQADLYGRASRNRAMMHRMNPNPNQMRPQQNPLVERYKQNILGGKRNGKQTNGGHYVSSSAMSDTSEAPSLASHVRNVKVPQHNDADLDQYLDDLFNPLLDDVELDEMSDARSMAASIRAKDLSNLWDPAALAKSIRGNEEEERETLSPTFESLLRSLKSESEVEEAAESTTSGSKADKTSIVADLTENMNLSELKALNEKLESEIEAAQSRRASLELIGEHVVPEPPPQPSFGNPQTLEDINERAKTIRIGKWRWPPAQEEQAVVPAKKEEEVVPKKVEVPKQQQVKPIDGGSIGVGKLKISHEMKAKLEQLTNSSGGGRESSCATPTSTSGGLVSQAKSLLAERNSQVGRFNEQRKRLLESQLTGGGSGSASSAAPLESESRFSSDFTSGSKVLAAKQQLAAAAGVALAALDSSPNSQASSRRQSSQMIERKLLNDGEQGDQFRSSRLFQDELGPQSKSAISQRQAFYQMSASSDHIETISAEPCPANASSELQLSTAAPKEAPIPAPSAVSSDNLESSAKQPLVRAMQMSSNLNEVGREGSELAKESDRVYNRNLFVANLQRQQESLRAAPEHQWVSSSPDPTLESKSRRQKRAAKQTIASKPYQAAKLADLRKEDEVECLVYANVDWQVKVRKELFLPNESYEDPLVVQLIFAQLVADVFNPRHWTRLNQKERAALKALMKDNSIGYAASLPGIGEMQLVKRELIRMARSFGLYFTRSYAATNYALTRAQQSGRRQRPRRRRRSCSDSSGSSTAACSDDDDDQDEQSEAAKLALRLRNAANLGALWFDLVAVHHSGLRLVSVVEEKEAAGAVRAQNQQTPLGYKVIETLKYRDMTDVAQVGQRELLVSMRNGNKCWLLSSSQATQLGSLLKCFLADYNDHLSLSGAQNKLIAAQQQAASNKTEAPQRREKAARAKKNALLASHDDHHGDRVKQRQTSNRIGELRPAPNSNNDLANSERVLSNNLANIYPQNSPSFISSPDAFNNSHSPQSSAPIQALHRQHQQQQSAHISSSPDQLGSISPPTTSSGLYSPPATKLCANGQASGLSLGEDSQRKSSTATIQQEKRQNLWQNSLSRMSTKFSIFGGSQASRATSSKSNEIDLRTVDSTSASAQAQQVHSSVQIDAWIETKVDFDEDEEVEAPRTNEQQQVETAHVEEQGQVSLGSEQVASQQQQVAKNEDGKYSMLQFALYNFREAIEKYSLESRLSKAQIAPGDTSTLRGSLKLIESLRRSESSSSKHDKRHQTNALATAATDNDWTWRELAEMVKFTQSPIKQSLLRLPSEDLNRRAVDCFHAIMQYMGDLPANVKQQHLQEGEVECVYLILMNCHNFPILRDEIYCQLMKQTTNNRSLQADSCLRGWRLFSIVAAYFDCSQTFKAYLVKYLETAAYDKRRAYCSIALLCLKNLRKTFKYNGRKNVPSIEEIAATSAGRNSKRQIYRLPGGTERVINTKSTTVVEDIIHEICSNMLNVTDQNEMLEFSLYCIADGDLYTMPLNRDEYILDITTELIKNHRQYFLIFCRSIWHYPLRLDSKLYIEVIFNQIAPDYLEGLLLVLPSLRDLQQQQPIRLKTKMVKELARIAALLHRASGTDYMPHKDEIKYLLPKPIVSAMKQHNKANYSISSNASSADSDQLTANHRRESGEESGSEPVAGHSVDLVSTSPQKWLELVQNNWRDMSAFDTLDAKAQFLEIVRHWPLFGSSFFAIKLIQRDLIKPMDFIFALNKLGIQMLDMITHETIHKYPFNEVISTRKVRSEDGALYLDMKCGNLMKRTIIRIQTDQAHEISRLIRQYIDIELLQQKQQQQQQVAQQSANPHQSDSIDQD